MSETVTRKGKYALVAPAGSYDWWAINDMEGMFAVVSIRSDFPNAEAIVRFAWEQIK